MKLEPLCLIKTPFVEKFGVPRQPLLIEEAVGVLEFPKNDFYSEAFRGIEGYSHLWLIFSFHQVGEDEICALVRPPRFKGKQKLGVFATRSPHRPNRLGLSVVKFDGLEVLSDKIVLRVRGVDLVNGTPILDIKPYVPYADSHQASSEWFDDKPERLPVIWQTDVFISDQERSLIEKIIGLDPRPGHDQEDKKEFGVTVGGWNARFFLNGDHFVIKELTRAEL